jgi:hypothetical protein
MEKISIRNWNNVLNRHDRAISAPEMANFPFVTGKIPFANGNFHSLPESWRARDPGPRPALLPADWSGTSARQLVDDL